MKSLSADYAYLRREIDGTPQLSKQPCEYFLLFSSPALCVHLRYLRMIIHRSHVRRAGRKETVVFAMKSLSANYADLSRGIDGTPQLSKNPCEYFLLFS